MSDERLDAYVADLNRQLRKENDELRAAVRELAAKCRLVVEAEAEWDCPCDRDSFGECHRCKNLSGAVSEMDHGPLRRVLALLGGEE